MKEEEDKAKLQLLKYYMMVGISTTRWNTLFEWHLWTTTKAYSERLIVELAWDSWPSSRENKNLVTLGPILSYYDPKKNLPYIWFFWEGIGCGSFTRKTISICQQSPYRHWGKICPNRERTFSCCFRTWKVPSIYLWTKRNSSEWS